MRRSHWRRGCGRAALGAAALLAACASGDAARPEEDGETLARAEAALREQFPDPVSVSPDGALLLLKDLHPRAFELAVTRRADGAFVARAHGPDKQQAPAWRPDGGALAFLVDRGGDQRYRPVVLDLASGATDTLAHAPPTAAHALQWAPRGGRLAYVAGALGAPRTLVVLAPGRRGEPPRALVDDVAPLAGFAWLPDGRALAAVRRRDRAALWIAPLAGPGRRVPVVPRGEVREVAAAADGTLLVTVRTPGAPFFRVARVDPAGGAVRPVPTPPGDAAGLVPRPGGGFAFHAAVDGEPRAFLAPGGGAPPRPLGPRDGSTTVTGFSPRGDSAYLLHATRTTHPVLWAVPVDGGPAARLHAAARGGGPAPVAGERVDVPAPDGLRLPAYLWRAPPGAFPPAALVRVHGGPALQATPARDGGVQFAVDAGYHVLQLNYRGSTGYGQRFERAPGGDSARIGDVLAAVEYAVRVLGVPRERVVLFGHSYGARLVAGAAARDPRAAGGYVLVSLAPGRPLGAARAPVRAPVLAFHGARDAAYPPGHARAELEAVLGRGALSGGRFRVIGDEGHNFHRVDTWARVHAASLLFGARVPGGTDAADRPPP